MKTDKWLLLKCIAVPLLVGGVAAFITGGGMQNFETLNKPPLSPPGWLFPVVWTILYILMGISLYIGLESNSTNKDSALTIYIIQLVVNSLWTLIFFGFNNFLLGIFWIILLIILVITMIVIFYRIDKTAGLLQIPYLIWLCFALYLNTMIYLLN